jgi:cytochrome c-type biogenesis protein CcmF
MNFGNMALTVALIGGVMALLTYGAWGLGWSAYRTVARFYTALLALGVFAASAIQMYNIMTHQFQYVYVSSFSDRSLPPLLLASTFWGGQAGSLMLWTFGSTVFGLVLMAGLRRTAWEPYVLTPYMLVTLCITAITFASEPFKLNAQVPPDGDGLNPLLQNYWMAIHPPILFSGFTTLAGPFAFAVAALWKRDYDGWTRQAQPWTLLAWACMGTGLALGGFWAYESLGWGGFWGWDPVENSSLIPWLFTSALLHGLILQRARGSLKRVNMSLAVVAYLTVIYSTFLTRSGVLGDFSVHSFVELGLMRYLVGFIALFAVLGLGMLVWRWRAIGRRVVYTHVLSREFGLAACMTLFVLIALIVGVGTSMPVISLLPVFPNQLSMDLGWYGPTVAPLGFLLLLTMAVGPLLGWQRSKYGSLRALLRWPLIATAIVVFACLLLNVIYPLALLFIGAAVFATVTNVAVIVRIWRAGPLKLGGYLAHVGVGILFVGIVGTSLYKQTASLQLIQDTPQQVFGRQWTFRGVDIPADDPLKRRALQIEVTEPQSGRTWLAQPPYYINVKSDQLVTHPAIESGWWSDLYVAPSDHLPAPQLEPGLLQLLPEQSVQLDGYRFTFQDFEIPDPTTMMRGGDAEILARLTVVAPDGTTTRATPMLRMTQDRQMISEPIPLFNGVTLALERVDATSEMAVVRVKGLDLSGVNPDDLKARAFVEVSSEPGIKFVWAGIILSVLGGLVALVRRAREGRPPVAVQRRERTRRAALPGRALPDVAVAQTIRRAEEGSL